MWKTWANLLTLARLLCVAPCAWAIVELRWVTAALLFTAAVVTDFLDGAVARRQGRATALGGLLDHATDAIFVTVSLGALAYLGYITPLLPGLIALAFAQYTADSKALAGRRLRTSWLGRNNGIAYYVLVGVPVIRNAVDLGWPPDHWINALGWLLCATTLASMLDRGVAATRARQRRN